MSRGESEISLLKVAVDDEVGSRRETGSGLRPDSGGEGEKQKSGQKGRTGRHVSGVRFLRDKGRGKRGFASWLAGILLSYPCFPTV